MNFDIKGKVALVTGANRGIGEAIVESFVRHGATKVYAAVRDLDKAAFLVEKLGEVVVPVYVDISKPESISALADTVPDVHLVVNNAGVLEVADPLSDNAEQALNHELNINVFGLIRIAQAFITVIEKNGGGAFVQLNSVASIKNFAAFSTYSASKAAAYSITQGLRDIVAEKGIAVLSVHPGPIATNMAESAGMGEMAEPASVVSEGIITALKEGDFHLFPDSMAKSIEEQYQSYAKNIIEATE